MSGPGSPVPELRARAGQEQSARAAAASAASEEGLIQQVWQRKSCCLPILCTESGSKWLIDLFMMQNWPATSEPLLNTYTVNEYLYFSTLHLSPKALISPSHTYIWWYTHTLRTSGLQAHTPSLHLADACLPLLHDHSGQMSFQAVLGPSFAHTVYIPTPIFSCCYPGHFAQGGPCQHWHFCCCFPVQKEKIAVWESRLRRMWRKQVRHRQLKGIQLLQVRKLSPSDPGPWLPLECMSDGGWAVHHIPIHLRLLPGDTLQWEHRGSRSEHRHTSPFAVPACSSCSLWEALRAAPLS